MALLVALAWLVSASAAVAAGPGAYTARRFDVNATVVKGGNLDVTETVTFAFESGTFRKVWRDIPASRTDGVEVLDAWMDGNRVTLGDGPGHISLDHRNAMIRVEWEFAPAGPSTHTFTLRYIARGVATRDGASDVVRWRLLPAEHKYGIDASRATIVGLLRPSAAPALESRRVGRLASTQPDNTIEIVASEIRANGWVIAEVHYPAGSVVTSLPGWQQRQLTAAALAPKWGMAAGGILAAGVLLLLIVRQGYPSPDFDGGHTSATEPPQALPAAIAATLAAKGRASGYQAVTTLLDLADRGVFTVRELPRRLGTRHYELSQVAGKHDLENHEAAALMIAFAGAGDEVTLSKASGRLARGGRRFREALNDDLASRGMLDASRQSARNRLLVASIVMLFGAGAVAIGVAPLIPRYDGWPFLLPLALALCGIAGVVMAASTTPLSDAGLIESARWRGFQRHLKARAGARDDGGGSTVPSRWIVYGIALGLAQHWSRYLKRHPGAAPAWFVAATPDDGGGGFAALVAASAFGSGHAGGGGAAAGGGGSGAA